MSLIDRAFDSRAFAYRPHSVQNFMRIAFTAGACFVKNRMAIKKVIDLDDAMLNDIGLTRADVERAYIAPLSKDPMMELKAAARKRSSHMLV